MLRSVLALAVIAAALSVVAPLSAAEQNSYAVHPLVSNQPGVAPTLDPSLVNAWGLAAGRSTPWWVADNETDLSTLYTGAGVKLGLEVEVDGGPTGLVFNDSGAFAIGGVSPFFIFASEDGIIRGWNPAFGTASQVAVDNSPAGASYKGLAIAATASGPMLYAADFHNARVDVFDSTLAPVPAAGRFVDPRIPTGFAPFGIQAIGSRIFVAYARQDEDAEDEVAGQGLGFVDAYDTAGNLVARVAQHGQLNAPWGLAPAPEGFGRFGGDLLVGNFGDGEINAYAEQPNGHFEHRGELRGADGKPISIDGLWALQFGTGGLSGPTDTLFFTAGPNEEQDGLFGSITAG